MDEPVRSNEHYEHGDEGARQSGIGGPERSSYQAPLLRSHGRLLDHTAQQKPSGEGPPSDVNLKENIAAIVWG